jgi:hypothetical protein
MAIELPGVFFIIFKAVPITFPWLSPSFAAFQPCDEKKSHGSKRQDAPGTQCGLL